jgi:hypothetical protein
MALMDADERGNKKAFSTVRIPTVDEERERAMSQPSNSCANASALQG